MNFIEQNPFYSTLRQELHPEDFEVLKRILNNHEFDLFPAHGYFEKNDFDNISRKSISIFFDKIKTYKLKDVDGEELNFLWSQVINEFQKKYWGFKKYQEKPTTFRDAQKLDLPLLPQSEVPKKPAEKVSYKDAFFYIWSVLQAMIITKALILVFGNQLAKDDSLENRILFGLVMIFSFGSLFLFAWLRRKNPK